MQQIIFFFIRNKNFLLFFVLFAVSVGLTIRSHDYHNSKFFSSANFLSGGIYSIKSGITGYFNLKEQNQQLVEENNRLRALIEIQKEGQVVSEIDSSQSQYKFKFVPAKVINNNFSRTKNQLTLDRGRNDSLKIDMGVITSKGVVGIVNSTSANYASVQSILNTQSQINAKLKKSDHFGTLKWDTKDPAVAQLIEIPRLAPVALGDTIVTGGRSTIFPEGILIGVVQNFDRKAEEDYYDIDVALFNDMTNIRHVYVIENVDAEEIKELENEVENVEQ